MILYYLCENIEVCNEKKRLLSCILNFRDVLIVLFFKEMCLKLLKEEYFYLPDSDQMSTHK